jgi:hypothetical protein
MRSPVGIAVIIAVIAVAGFVLGATFFEPKRDGPFERAGQKVDDVLKK